MNIIFKKILFVNKKKNFILNKIIINNLFSTQLYIYKKYIQNKIYHTKLLKNIKTQVAFSETTINFFFFLKKKIQHSFLKKISTVSIFLKKKKSSKLIFFSKNIMFLEIILSKWSNFIFKKGKKYTILKKILEFFQKIFYTKNLNPLHLFQLFFNLVKPIFDVDQLRKLKLKFKRAKINYKVNIIFNNFKKQFLFFVKKVIPYSLLKKLISSEKFFFIDFLTILKKKLYLYHFLTKKKFSIRSNIK